MNNYYTKKLEELLTENRNLYKQNIKLKEELSITNNKICNLNLQISTLTNQISIMDKEIKKLESDIKIKDNKYIKQKLIMDNEFRRKDILNNKLIGTTKNIREIELKNEINKLYLRNNILCKFLQDIFDQNNLDFKLFYDVLETINNSDDNILKIFIKEIIEKRNLKEEIL